MQLSTGTVASTSVLRLACPRSKALCYVQTVSGSFRHFSRTRTVLNTNGSSGNNSSGKLVADKINIDPKTKLRMEIRKEAMDNNSARGGNNSNNSGNKWKPAENWDPNQPGRYRQAYEENQNRSGYRPNNNSSSGNRRQAQDARRPGRYYDERSGQNAGQNAGQNRGGQHNQQRQNAPSSFATSSGFGFSAPTPAPKPAAPSSFATSSGFGFSSPAKAAKPTPASPPSKVNAQPNTLQKIKAEKPMEVSPTPSTSSSSSTAGTTTGSTATTTGATPAPTPKTSSPSSSPSSSTSQASSTSTQASSSSQKTPPTFTKSTRSAKENAKRHVEQRSKHRKQRQKPAKDVFIPEAINVSNLAGLLGARMPHFERTMKAMGMEITRHDHILTSEEASLLALEYNVNPIVGNTETLFDLTSHPEPEDMSIYPLRPPVVTIMGH
ncbi:hypothetical protein BGZ82_004136, partial [Podila clonocystis]